MRASDWFSEARYEALQAGKQVKRRGRAKRYLAAHPLPPVTVEELIREAYELGER